MEGVELGKEGLVGLITYMRTDSTRISDDALKETREFIAGERYGPAYLPASPNIYKSKKDAQDAHRSYPPDVGAEHTPEAVAQYLAEDEMKLYRLIWMRFVASQMMPAVFDQTTIEVSATGQNKVEYLFRANFGARSRNSMEFLRVYVEGKDEKDEEDEELKHKLPLVVEGEVLRFRAIRPEQHFTEPPPRCSS